jgi:hypothetical protein
MLQPIVQFSRKPNARSRKFLWGLLAAGLMVLAGCGSAGNAPPRESADMAPSGAASTAASEAKSAAGNAAGAGASVKQIVQAVSMTPRKIIYTAEVSLVAENLTTAQNRLLQLVKTHKGYVAETQVGGNSGSPRQGSWKVRVPESQYESFMAQVARMGELQTVHSDSKDVSEEYYDIEARISNKQVEERRLVKLLEQATGKLREILEVEREISRVRGEIEQMQGRLRVLANLSALTTITITINEIKDYVPPAPPTFSAQIARAFATSLGMLRDLGKTAVLAAVGLAPWIVVFGLPAAFIWLLLRRRIARRTKPGTPS